MTNELKSGTKVQDNVTKRTLTVVAAHTASNGVTVYELTCAAPFENHTTYLRADEVTVIA